MKKVLLAILLLGSTMGLHAAKVDKKVSIVINSQSREYWLYVPDNVQQDAPLVVSLHGASGHCTDKSPFRTDVADKEGCIVVYPQGNPIYFPVFGGTVTGWDATGVENADVKFLKAVIEDVAQSYSIDRKRIYACGFSNGGMMTYALTNCCSELFAAFASISGYPLNEFHFRHTAPRPVPFMHIHGKKDDFVLYSLMPVIVDEMVARLGANPVPEKTSQSGYYDKSVYEGVVGSFPYTYYEIDGMGHNDFTTNTEDGNSSLTMWNFFKQYTLDMPYDATLRWRPRIEEAGFDPKSHGWVMNRVTTLLSYGDQKTDDNQNVYHSLQLTKGNYKLSFSSEGDADKTITVKISKQPSGKLVYEGTATSNENATMSFSVDDAWSDYKILFKRQNKADQITIKNIELRIVPDETGIRNINSKPVTENHYYNLNGQRVAQPTHGLYVINGHKVVKK